MALIITIVNVSDLADVSDYKVAVLVGDGTVERSKLLYETRINGHRRADGWEMLLQRFVSHLPVEPK